MFRVLFILFAWLLLTPASLKSPLVHQTQLNQLLSSHLSAPQGTTKIVVEEKADDSELILTLPPVTYEFAQPQLIKYNSRYCPYFILSRLTIHNSQRGPPSVFRS